MSEIAKTIQTIEVKRKKSAAGVIGRGFCLIVGGLGFIMSALLMITIIGAIPGFFMMVGSTGFLALAIGFQNVKCPSCKKVNTVSQHAEDFKCKRCSTPVIIDWTK